MDKTEEGPQVLSCCEVARALGVTEDTVRSWCRVGAIPGAWQAFDGAPWHIPRVWLEQKLAAGNYQPP